MSSGVQLHPTSLPGGRLGRGRLRVRRLARRGGPVVVADAAARPARPHGSPYKSPSAFAAWPGLLAEPRRARSPTPSVATSASARRTGSRTGLAFGARGDLADQVRFDREWAALRAYAAERGVRLIGDVPIYVAPGSADHARAPGALPRRRRRRRAARRVHRQGPAVGQPALRLAGAAARDGYRWWVERLRRTSSSSTSRASTTSAASSPTGRSRRGARDALGGSLEARARAARCSTPPRAALGATAADRRGPRRHHAAGRAAARRRSGFPGMAVLQFGFDPGRPAHPARAREPRRGPGRLHRHPRQRHRPRLVRRRCRRERARWSTASLADAGVDDAEPPGR